MLERDRHQGGGIPRTRHLGDRGVDLGEIDGRAATA